MLSALFRLLRGQSVTLSLRNARMHKRWGSGWEGAPSLARAGHGRSRAASVSILEFLAEVGLLLLEGSFLCRTRSEYSCVLEASHKCGQWKPFSFFHVYSLLSPFVSPHDLWKA